ncbi:unnamed protein product [Camellia sinensis]
MGEEGNMVLLVTVKEFGMYGKWEMGDEVLKLGNSTRINEQCLELQKNIKDDVSKMKVGMMVAAFLNLVFIL